MSDDLSPATRCLVIYPEIASNPARRSAVQGLAEAVSLASALSLDVVDNFVVRLKKAQAGMLFGSGKIQEIAQIIEDEEITLVLIDGPVSPIQQRNLEKRWGINVIDRTGLILEIFGARAQTREGVLQVELAALSYQKSRLVRSWTHLERQRGGLSFVGGAGETQIESDRRAIDDAIVRLKRQLAKVAKTRSLHRAARTKVPYPIVALVGYTNAGKSTIFNRLTGADVMAKDMLFATLDPTMRSIKLPSGKDIILSDTVGFISELPTQLVAAFRATLEEVLDADLILHVRDISHGETHSQAQDVRDILLQLGINETAQENVVEIWNKIDLIPTDQTDPSRETASRLDGVVATSALSGEGFDQMLQIIDEAIAEKTSTELLELTFSDGKKRAWLFAQNVVNSESQEDYGFAISVTWSAKQSSLFKQL